MTAAEFATEFDVIYENINKNGAPGLDGYEVSVILSHAQELLVKEVLKIEPEADRFPDLIQVFNSSAVTAGDYGTNSFKFPLPTGYLKILNEKVEDVSENVLQLFPISNSELQTKKAKAYAYPPRRRGWRISTDDSAGSVEVYVRPGFIPTDYFCRYVKKPSPIITETLVGVSIDGQTAIATSELDEGLHRDILKIAASLAEQYYMDKYGTDGNK